MTDSTNRLKVLIAEDHFLARLAVATLVGGEPDMVVVGQAETGHAAVRLFEKQRPDLTLMDLRLPEMDGFSAMAAILRIEPSARVLVLSSFESEEDVARALSVGARGYVKKDVEGSVLLSAMRAVARGEKYLPPSVRERLENRSWRATLSRRETEVLCHLYKGLSNPEIAAALSISEGTVRIHVSNLMMKLGAKRRGEAVNIGLRRGLIPTE